MRKRLLASLMCVCMLFGMLPTAALAADSSGNSTAIEAIEIKITDDTERVSYTFTSLNEGKEYVLDSCVKAEIEKTLSNLKISKEDVTELSVSTTEEARLRFADCVYIAKELTGLKVLDITYADFFDDTYAGDWLTSANIDHRIPTYAFWESSSIETIYPFSGNNRSVTTKFTAIGPDAFAGTQLSGDIVIPDTVTEVAGFNGTKITGINKSNGINYFDGNIKVIGQACVYNTASFTGGVVFGDKVEKISPMAFQKSPISGPITIGTPIKEIGSSAFQECPNITSIYVGSSVKDFVTTAAFKNCKALESIIFEDGATATIGSNPFNGCDRLEYIYCGDNVNYHGTFDCKEDVVIVLSTSEQIDHSSLNMSTTKNAVIYTGKGDVLDKLADVWTFNKSENVIAAMNGGKLSDHEIYGDKTRLAEPVREGYIFGGWYEKEDCTGKPLEGEPKNGQTYYAKWIELTATDITMTYGDEKPLSDITVAGLTLDNWASANEAVVKIDNAAGKLIATGAGTTTITADASLTKSGEKLKVTVKVSPKAFDTTTTATATGTYTYTGEEITPTVTVKMGEKLLTENDYTVAASNNVNAGEASFTVTGKGNYTGSVTGTFAIGKAPLTVTADDKTMVLGGAVPAFTYTVEGLMGEEELTYDPTLFCAAEGKTLGTFDITISGAVASSNYGEISYVNGKLTVTEKADVSGQMTVTAPASLVYDGTAKAYTAACAGISQWTYTYTDAQGKTLEAVPVNAGAYTVTISGTGDASFAQKTVNFTIEKAPLTIQAEDQTIRAGKDLPEFTYTVTGLVEGEKLAKEPTLTCDTDGKTPGEYPIVPSRADAGDNYEISYKNGTLTVTKRASSGGSADKEYSVSVDDGKNGTVSISPKRAEKGDTVTITVKPDKGYELDELIVTDSKGREIDLREKGGNKFTFKMPGSKVTVEATFRAVEEIPEKPQLVNPFVDVNENAYYHDAVLWAVEKGITGGTTAATFSPDDACTRAQMVTFLWRAAGSPVVNYAMSFTDVPADAYYAEAVRWAVSQGITAGTSASTFAPNATVTRGQTVTFLWRAAGSPVVNSDSFADVAADAYYAPAVAWAVREGITSGVGAETFAPSADCTRGQIVTFLYRDMAK